MADNRFSLTQVRLRHYRSIASADVSLGDLLLLVGPNGSGKSNFLDALRLLSESLQTSLDQALRSRGLCPRSAGGRPATRRISRSTLSSEARTTQASMASRSVPR